MELDLDKLASEAPTLKVRLDGIHFSSGRDMNTFCDAMGEDFDRVTWTQEQSHV